MCQTAHHRQVSRETLGGIIPSVEALGISISCAWPVFVRGRDSETLMRSWRTLILFEMCSMVADQLTRENGKSHARLFFCDSPRCRNKPIKWRTDVFTWRAEHLKRSMLWLKLLNGRTFDHSNFYWRFPQQDKGILIEVVSRWVSAVAMMRRQEKKARNDCKNERTKPHMRDLKLRFFLKQGVPATCRGMNFEKAETRKKIEHRWTSWHCREAGPPPPPPSLRLF